jgi:hypothetical protein
VPVQDPPSWNRISAPAANVVALTFVSDAQGALELQPLLLSLPLEEDT